MQNIIIFIGLFILIYLFYFFFVIRKPRMLEKLKRGKELTLLKSIYHLDYSKLNMKRVANTVALANSFILSLMTTLVTLINDWINNFYIWLIMSLVMAFILMIPITLIIYHCIGRYYSKKQKGVE